MKSAKKMVLAILLIIAACVLLVGCTRSVGDANALHKATNGGSVKVVNDVATVTRTYKGKKNDIEITNDFTVSKSDSYFMELVYASQLDSNLPGRMMSDSVINGNGHTITVTGDDTVTTLGSSTAGFFYRLMNCTVKDLNIVYDTKVSMKGYGSGNGFGGLVAYANDCTFINCTVTYKTPLTFNAFPDRYGYNSRKVGGFIGSGTNCTFTNCRVNGEINGVAANFGGFAGSLTGGSVLDRCMFNGKLNTYSIEGCNIGGLVGYTDGDIKGCKVYLTDFDAVGEPQGWRQNTACVGGIVGSLDGSALLMDSYLEFAPGATFSISNKLNGTFGTEMHSGLVAGHALAGSLISRVYVNADTDFCTNIVCEDDIALGLFNGEGSVVQVFFVENSFNVDYEETFDVVIDGDLMSGYSTEFEIDGVNIHYSILTERDEDDVYHVTDAELVIAGERITLRNKDITTLDSIYLFHDTVDMYRYSVTLNLETSKLTFKRTHNKIHLGGATAVDDFDGIIFDSSDDSLWKFDENGKPYIEGLE